MTLAAAGTASKYQFPFSALIPEQERTPCAAAAMKSFGAKRLARGL